MAEIRDLNRFRGMIGLAAKAGKIRSGEFSAEESIKSNKARICILPSDASERTQKHFNDMCNYRDIPIFTVNIDKEALGHMIGRGARSSVVIEDAGFVKSILGLIDGGIASGK